MTTPGVGTNRYSYSFNDPVNLSDPNGNVVPLLAIGAALVLGGLEVSDNVGTAISLNNARQAHNDGNYQERDRILSEEAIAASVGAATIGGRTVAKGLFRLFGRKKIEIEPGYNITPDSTINQHSSIGRNGTFLTDRGSFERVLGRLDEGASEIQITKKQAHDLEDLLGLDPGSLESSNTLSIVRGVSNRNPRLPTSGNSQFKPGGRTIGGSPEIVIDSVPTNGGSGVQQIKVIVK